MKLQLQKTQKLSQIQYRFINKEGNDRDFSEHPCCLKLESDQEILIKFSNLARRTTLESAKIC